MRVLVLVDLAHRRVAARLEHSDEPPARILRRHRRDRLAHGRRVVREVVDHGDAARLSAQLLPALHSAEGAEARRDLLRSQAEGAARREHAEGVLHVVPPGGRKRDAELARTAEGNFERGARGTERDATRRPVRLRAVLRAVALHAAARERGEPLPVWEGGAGCGVTAGRHQRVEFLERALVVRSVAVDVRVIEFGAGDDRCARPVVQELGPLVEVGGVVLVAFEDEVLALPEPESLVEVERHASDQQARIAPCVVQHLREQAGRRRLPMRAGDDDGVARSKKQLLERFGEAHVRDAAPP